MQTSPTQATRFRNELLGMIARMNNPAIAKIRLADPMVIEAMAEAEFQALGKEQLGDTCHCPDCMFTTDNPYHAFIHMITCAQFVAVHS